tara:strand:- start:1611 stop:2567 length:957 start_codon:yes stop_codon:yes gene_type:complete
MNDKKDIKKEDIQKEDIQKGGIKKEDNKNFENSAGITDSLLRLATNIPKQLISNISLQFVNVINSILQKMLFYFGIELSKDDNNLDEKVNEVTSNIKVATYILYKVFEDPEVKENVRQLSILLNDTAFKPFLDAALISYQELETSFDEASNKLTKKIDDNARKLGDAVIGAAEGVIGTTPYIGNIYNAGVTAANTLQGVQAIADTTSALVLETAFRILVIFKKIQSPALDAVDGFVDFALTAYNTYIGVQNKIDQLNATLSGLQNFNPALPLNKEQFLKKTEEAGKKAELANKTGGRKKRKKTKKRHQKKRTKSRKRK